MNNKYCMMAVDCDPDREVYPELQWLGLESLYSIMDIIPLTFSVRRDWEIERKTGDIDYCFQLPVIKKAEELGMSIGIHYHSVDVNDNFTHDPTYLDAPNKYKSSFHSGFGYEGFLSDISSLGYKLDFSPMPDALGDRFNWLNWKNNPTWDGDTLRMPVQTMSTRACRAKNNTATVHPTAPHILFKKLVREFEKTDNDTLCCYFHADELCGRIGGFRNFVYGKYNLKKNIKYLKKRGYIFEDADAVYDRYLRKRND